MKKQIDLIQEIIRKINLISIKTRKQMSHILAGDNTTRMLGHGLSFDQTREYQHGDDVRLIDWKAYARTQTLVTKQYTEERRKKIFVLCDVSRSSSVDTGLMSKSDVSKTALSIIMLAAAHRNDQVSTLLYADKVITTTTPTSNIAGVSSILRNIFLYNKDSFGTCLKEASRELIKRQKKGPATVFIISDFIDNTVHDELSMLMSLYDVYAIRILDPIELRIPPIGLLQLTDIETGKEYILDTNKSEKINALLHERIENQNKLFKRFGIPVLDLYSHNPNIVDTMIRFFKKMEKQS